MLSAIERTHIYLSFDDWKDLMRLYLTCKSYKQELDDKYMIQLLCQRHKLQYVDLSLSFHTIGRLNYDIDGLLVVSCKTLDTEMVKKCVCVKVCIQMPLLDELITIVIVESSKKQSEEVHPLIKLFLDESSEAYDYMPKYAAMSWNIIALDTTHQDDRNEALALHFSHIMKKKHSYLCNFLEIMCRDGMILGLKRSAEHWHEESLHCLDQALKYNNSDIVNYLTTQNENVKSYLTECDSNKKYWSTQAFKCGSCYLANYIDPTRWRLK